MKLHVRPFDRDKNDWIFNILDDKGLVVIQFKSNYGNVRSDCGIENPSILGTAILEILGVPPITILTPEHNETYPLQLSWHEDSCFVEIVNGELCYRDVDRVKYM